MHIPNFMENLSFCQRCEHVFSNLPSSLASEKNRKNILQICSFIHPSFFPNLFLLENCISDDEENSDFCFFIKSIKMDEFCRSFAIDDFFYDYKCELIVDFLKDSIKNRFFEKKIPGVWIAFDLRGTSAWPPQPNLYLRLEGSREEKTEIIEAVFRTLKQKKIPAQTEDLLPNFFSEGFFIPNIGVMLARSVKPLRISPASRELLSADAYIDYLNRIGLSGLHKSFKLICNKIKKYISNISFEFDIDNHTHEKFGVCLYIPDKIKHSEKTGLWSCILNILASDGLVHEKKKNDILRWCGHQLESADCSSDFGTRKILNRKISHIKIVYSSQIPVQAKVYLLCNCLQL